MKRKTTPEQEELFCQTCVHYDNDFHHNQTEYCYANCLNCKGYDGYHPRANYNNMLEDEHKKTLYMCQKLMKERKKRLSAANKMRKAADNIKKGDLLT